MSVFAKFRDFLSRLCGGERACTVKPYDFCFLSRLCGGEHG